MTFAKFGKIAGITLPILAALGTAFYWVDSKIEKTRESTRTESTQQWQGRFDDMRRYNETLTAAANEQHKMKLENALRDKELVTSKTISDVKLQADAQQRKSSDIISNLREQLAAARESIQIREGEIYLSLNQLRISRNEGVKLMGLGNHLNFKNLIIPDFSKIGWAVTEDVSIKQIADLEKKSGAEIHLRPEEVDPKDPNWWPLGVLFTKNEGSTQARVAVFAVKRNQLKDVLSVIYTDQETPNAISALPLGIVAQMLTTGLVFDKNNFTSKTRVEEFSARKDAYYLCLRSPGDESLWTEIIAFEDGESLIFGVSECTSNDILHPTLEEARRWIKELRIVKD